MRAIVQALFPCGQAVEVEGGSFALPILTVGLAASLSFFRGLLSGDKDGGRGVFAARFATAEGARPGSVCLAEGWTRLRPGRGE